MRSKSAAVAAVAVPLFAVALAGCAFVPETVVQREDAVTEPVSAIEFELSNGRVEISVGDVEETTIERTLRYRGSREREETTSFSGGTLSLEGCGRWCSVDYVIEVPAEVDVRGTTSSGRVVLAGVGDVEVRTDNGAIELDGVSGRVRAETSNGRIGGRALAGDGVEASTSNGEIDLELAVPQPVDATTSNGKILLVVPPGSYRVDTDTSNGSVDVDIDASDGGEFLLDLQTSNGSITVREE